ncbi:MAG: response regulator transcription factor [Bacteroidaceae bacterium]|nr:response regulator transcription factor [Bacteroidaceae bacterium]
MMINCAIIDDEPLALGLIESYVNKTPFLNLVGKYSSAVQAMHDMSSLSVNLLFLDIQMPELSGMEFSRLVPPETRIIFTTAFSQYALDGYKVNALDYLLKPISYQDFLKAANKALQWFEIKAKSEEGKPGEADDYIYIKSDYKIIKIELSKILYIEGLKDYVKFYMEDEAKPYLSLMSMKSLEESLPQKTFKRIHRSFIVNMSKIQTIDRGRIVFGKEYIPVSDTNKQWLADYLKDKMIN